MTSKWAKFRLLMWKNYLLQRRHPFQTILEISIPVLFATLLVLIRSLVSPEIFSVPTIYPPLPLHNFHQHFTKLNNYQFLKYTYEIAYSPQNNEIDKLMEVFKKDTRTENVTALASSADLELHMIKSHTYFGIEFPDEYKFLKELPDNIEYSIRFPAELRRTNWEVNIYYNWHTDTLFPFKQFGGARNSHVSHDGVPSGYYIEGFLSAQEFLFKAFSRYKNKMNIDLNLFPKIKMRKFPYPPFVYDGLLQALEIIVALFFLLSFIYPCVNFVKQITIEKEKQLKEAMKIMGLDSWLHWTAWFTKCFIYMLITVTFMTILMKVKWYGEDNPNSVFTYSSATVLWTFLLLYSITTIMFCFMLSVFFSKADIAAAVSGLVFFLIYCPYSLIIMNYDLISMKLKVVMCLFLNTGMALGIDIILRYEGTQEGMQWHNIFKPVSVNDTFHLGHVIIMLIVDAIIYLLIALYVEKIFPGDYGVAEKWNFPFSSKFWFKVPEYVGVRDVNSNDVNHLNPNYEHQPKNKAAGIQIYNLRKTFDNNRVAVEGLNLNMYEDQITVLLGHNGAGKTTTMSMVTGMIQPTSGTAIINGKDIRRDMNAIRSSIGFCPQHNILFEDLTVREHITFYSLLKGLHKDDVEREVEKYVKLLKLENKIDVQASGLSGGMKRKLSVGIALCANSKIVLFDEPSSGVDPGARRDLWDLLQAEKGGRTILLSTHFMLEADVLGDRIAIMSNGVLKAVGSPYFLKKQFGVGYHLVCVKKDASCDSMAVTELLRKYIPDVKKESEIGTELSYLLDDKNVLVFQKMLKELEENSKELNIESYGISLTTLEEVFLKVGTDNLEDESKPSTKLNGTTTSNKYENEIENGLDSNTFLVHKGAQLYLNQFVALMHKKVLLSWRNLLLIVIQMIIPIAFVSVLMCSFKALYENKNLPKLDLTMDTYKPSVTTIEFRSSDQSETIENKIFENYRKQFSDLTSLEIIHDDMIEHYLNKSKKYLARVNNEYLFGATIEKSSITVWFNNQPYHTSPISLSLVHNAMLRTICGENCSIKVSNKPLPYGAESIVMMLQAGKNLGFQLAFNIGFAMALLHSL
ncbi:hypothetical protein PVAND_000540 [Polypedilum vanderplanki]|uniref:ABC transporter domain-containing protein n=1 Tax=Polypedilum vanderplanki TaxID=319348 RepID=A0A9J6BKW6_POLVA|nr:hypothetical protein PVAND_000540 [Polypedilum vanderplanki]